MDVLDKGIRTKDVEKVKIHLTDEQSKEFSNAKGDEPEEGK